MPVCVCVCVHMCVCKVCKVCVTLYVEGGEGWENTSTFFVYTVPPPHSYYLSCTYLLSRMAR